MKEEVKAIWLNLHRELIVILWVDDVQPLDISTKKEGEEKKNSQVGVWVEF